MGLEDANGLEHQLKELQHRWYPHLQKCWLVISEFNAKLEPAVYSKDFESDDDPHRCFIFANEATLKQVRWRHFLSDCRPLMADYSVIEKQLEEEVIKAKQFLDENYQDIIENFDPKVIKLRKKTKVIMASGFLDGLDDDDSFE